MVILSRAILTSIVMLIVGIVPMKTNEDTLTGIGAIAFVFGFIGVVASTITLIWTNGN
jgi:hypothetical protein